MKDLDCVSVCPQQTLHYGFGRPSILKRTVGTKQIRRIFDFALWEELLAATVFVAVLLIYRGLYGLVPFLLTLALGAIGAYGTLVSLRILRDYDVALNRLVLRRAGSLTSWGVAFCAVMLLVGGLTVHSAVVRYSAFQGSRLYASVMQRPEPNHELADRSIAQLARARSWGIVSDDQNERMLADLFARRQRWQESEDSYRRLLVRNPYDILLREKVAFVLTNQERFAEAKREYMSALQLDPNRTESHYGLAGIYFHMGLPEPAERHLKEALRLRPDHSKAHYDLGAFLVARGAVDEGIRHLRECLRLDPGYGDGYYNLAVALATRGALDEAMTQVENAIALQPVDEQTQRFRAYLDSLIGEQADPEER